MRDRPERRRLRREPVRRGRGERQAADVRGELASTLTGSIEALARRLAELMAPRGARARARRALITAAEVARVVGRQPPLGLRARRGARSAPPRRRPAAAPSLRSRRSRRTARRSVGRRSTGTMCADRRRCAAITGPTRFRRASRAMVGRQARKRPGRRANAPRPGAGVGGAMKRLLPRSPRVAPPARLSGGQEDGDGE